MTVYYDLKKRGDRLEFHTGDCFGDVARGESLNRAINLKAGVLDPVYVADWVHEAMSEVSLFDMKLARGAGHA